MFQVEKINVQELNARYLKASEEKDAGIASEIILGLMQELLDTVKTIPVILEDWSNSINNAELTYDNIPPIVIDYIDEEIGYGNINPETMEKDIIALFEQGCLKNLIKDGEINSEALALFTKKRQRDLNKQKARLARTKKAPKIEDDIF